MLDGTDVDRLSKRQGWKRARLIYELRRAANARDEDIATDESMRRMIRLWVSGERSLSELHAQLLGDVFGGEFRVGKAEPATSSDDISIELDSHFATSVDSEVVKLFEVQTQQFRLLDRRIGAARLQAQTEAHVEHMRDFLTYALPGGVRLMLGAATAEGAALAGWQALDLGDPAKAWRLHEIARHAAADSDDPTIIAHVRAQQGYALIDIGRYDDAVRLMSSARKDATGRVPGLLMSWLWAAEGEAHAAAGNETAARQALDTAARILPPDEVTEELPFLALNDTHLARWRGHCLARLGSAEAVEELTAAVERHDPSFVRAIGGLRCDLALAHAVRGDRAAARAEAKTAAELIAKTASVRQRKRIAKLIGGE
jgi:tetratricopeptide (TPR) repeat protein